MEQKSLIFFHQVVSPINHKKKLNSSHHRLINDDLIFPFYWLVSLGGVSYKVPFLSVCQCVCLCHCKTTPCQADFWLKNVFLILACDHTKKWDFVVWGRRGSVFLYIWYVWFCTSILWIMRELAEEGLCTLMALQQHFNGA